MKTVKLWVVLVWVLGSIPLPALGQIAESPWPMFQHDMDHTGYSLFPGPINGAEVKFEAEIGAGYSSPVIGFDGTVYVGSSDGCLYAVPPDGRNAVCLYETGGQVRSTPVLSSNGRIYFGSDDGFLYALTLSGALLWRTELGDRVRSAPAIGPAGNIYAGSMQSSDSGFLFRVSPEGEILWRHPTGNISYSYPAIDSFGNVYIGSLDGNLYKLSSDGAELWRYPAGDAISSSPVIAPDGSIYFCSPDELIALNRDGELQWTFTPIARLFGFEEASGLVAAPAVDPDGRVYLGGVLGDLHCLDDRGEHQWSVMLKEPTLTDPVPLSILSSPVVWGGSVADDGGVSGQYVAVNVMEGVYTLSAADGSVRYSVGTGPAAQDNMTIMASPAISSSGMIVSANPDGSLYGIGPSGTLTVSGSVTGFPEDYPEDLRRRVFVNIQRGAGEVRQVRVDPDGRFAAPVFSRGTFLLTPQGSGLTFDPPSQEATVNFSGAVDADFTANASFPVILSAEAEPDQVSGDNATPVQFSVEVFWPGAGNLNGFIDLSEIGGSANEPMVFIPADPGSPELPGRLVLDADVPAGLSIGTKFIPVAVSVPLLGDRESRGMITLSVVGAYEGSGAATYEILVDQPWPLLTIVYASTDWRYGIAVFAPGSTRPDYSVETTADESEGVLEIRDPAVGTWVVTVTPLGPFEGAAAGGRATALGMASASAGQCRVSSSAAGTGVIFGSVSDLQTGELVINNSVQIRTASGSSSPTQEGFYVLLSPAGAFTVNALDLSGVYAPSVKSGSLMTGGSVEANLLMQPAGESSACALDFLFKSNPEPLGLLRQFRDRVLAATGTGRSLTRLYYGCAAEVKEILKSDPALQKESVRTAAALGPVVEKALRGGPIELSDDQKRSIESCLKKIRAHASAGLAGQISRILEKIESGALPGQLGG